MNYCIENKLTQAVRMRYVMGTFCRIQIEGEDGLFIEGSIEDVFSEFRRIEKVFSRYLEDSQISVINRDASKFMVEVDSEVFNLIARSLEFSRITFGAFDITVGAALDLWRLSETKDSIPHESQIREIKSKIGYQNVLLDYDKQSIHFKKSGIKIDLGAIAKGYALDRAVVVLRERGIKHAQINLGGNIYVLDNAPQKIAIRDPLSPDEIIDTVDLWDSSISTSANYERFFVIGNKRFGHLLNPLEAKPLESQILSASIISKDACLADALSTAVFVLGSKRAKDVVRNFPEAQAVIISKVRFGNRVKVDKFKSIYYSPSP